MRFSRLTMIAAGTHSAKDRARTITIWAAALSVGGTISSVLAGLVATLHFGSDPEAGWRWAFLIVLVLALISAALSLVLVPVVYEFVDDLEQLLAPKFGKLVTPREPPLQPAPEDSL